MANKVNWKCVDVKLDYSASSWCVPQFTATLYGQPNSCLFTERGNLTDLINELNGMLRSTSKIDRVIFNNPATIIYWTDGTKTVVKCQPGDTYDKEKGFMAAYLKKLLGNDNTFNKEIKKWVEE